MLPVLADDRDRPAGEAKRRTGLPHAALAPVVLAFAFILTYVTGQRGFYPFDQSIVFDGSYRILQGQIPFKDFILPFGPVAFWLHALFFRVLGIDYTAYILGAATVNALATLLSMAIMRLLFPSRKLTAYVAGAMTAVWFYPPFGTPWVDQTAFFFSFAALGALLAGSAGGTHLSSSRKGLTVLSGCLAFLAFTSKQNVGSFMLPAYPLLILVANLRDRRRLLMALALFVAGFGGSLALFLIWVGTVSDYDSFVRYFWRMPSVLGRERISRFAGSWFGLRSAFFGGRGPVVVILLVWGALAVSVASLAGSILGAKRKKRVIGGELVAAVLCIYLVGFQHLFTNTTLNQPENGLAFVGMVLAIALGLGLSLARGGRRILKGFIIAAALVVMIFASVKGVQIAMDRKVHDVLRGAEYGEPLGVEKLRTLRWAHPTLMGGFEITDEEFVRLYRYLEQRGDRFFVFPDFTILYGLLGQPSPQPLLWFHESVTYPRKGSPYLDRRIVEDLKRNDVKVFVLEQVAWFNTGDRLEAFPVMEEYLRSEFVKLGEIGTFSIHEKRED
jgi:hypothetical protein